MSYRLNIGGHRGIYSSSHCVDLFIGLEFLGDAESVHGVVVNVDEGFVAVVHSGDELTELCKVVQALERVWVGGHRVLVGAIDHIGGDTSHK